MLVDFLCAPVTLDSFNNVPVSSLSKLSEGELIIFKDLTQKQFFPLSRWQSSIPEKFPPRQREESSQWAGSRGVGVSCDKDQLPPSAWENWGRSGFQGTV